jgi:hypothetical protein
MFEHGAVRLREPRDIEGDAETLRGGPMRYVSWFGSWIGQLIPAVGRPRRRLTRDAVSPGTDAAQPSHEDLFYIAMLGPHM